MFTGIVGCIGKIKSKSGSGKSLVLEIESDFKDLVIGESIAVNGVCLTVNSFKGSTFYCDVSPETFNRTSFSLLRSGSLVNLERALRLSDRMGGHIVSGHIDGIARVMSFSKNENSINAQFSMTKDLGEYMIEKGSVAIDGVSLTIASVRWSGETCILSVAVIPHTWENTALKNKKASDVVNIECDVIAKYTKHFTEKDIPLEGEKYE